MCVGIMILVWLYVIGVVLDGNSLKVAMLCSGSQNVGK